LISYTLNFPSSGRFGWLDSAEDGEMLIHVTGFFFANRSGRWNFPEFRGLLEERLLRHLKVTDFECEHEFPRLGRKKIRINVRQVEAINTEDTLVVISLEEVV
jgi:hypothetical protein